MQRDAHRHPKLDAVDKDDIERMRVRYPFPSGVERAVIWVRLPFEREPRPVVVAAPRPRVQGSGGAA